MRSEVKIAVAIATGILATRILCMCTLCILLASERSVRDKLSRSSMENAIRIYIYMYIYRYVRHTFVARSWGDVMWEE